MGNGDIVIVDNAAGLLGCDAPPGSTTTVVTRSGKISYNGPFPCFKIATLRDLLEAKGVSWKYYYSYLGWNAFEYIAALRDGPEWKRNISTPASNVLSDIADGKLAQVSWVTPSDADSDSPASASRKGPAWVSSIVDAVKKRAYWKHTAIVVVWDGSGKFQFYDNAAPPQLSPTPLDFRVPMLIVSPYAKHGYVSHTFYQFGSVLKFIEQTCNLGSLGTTDASAYSIIDSFDFSR